MPLLMRGVFGQLRWRASARGPGRSRRVWWARRCSWLGAGSGFDSASSFYSLLLSSLIPSARSERRLTKPCDAAIVGVGVNWTSSDRPSHGAPPRSSAPRPQGGRGAHQRPKRSLGLPLRRGKTAARAIMQGCCTSTHHHPARSKRGSAHRRAQYSTRGGGLLARRRVDFGWKSSGEPSPGRCCWPAPTPHSAAAAAQAGRSGEGRPQGARPPRLAARKP